MLRFTQENMGLMAAVEIAGACADYVEGKLNLEQQAQGSDLTPPTSSPTIEFGM